MNQFFSFSRFWRLLCKYTAEHRQSYLMGVAVLAGGITTVLGGLTYITHRPLEVTVQGVLFVFGLLTTGATFTSTAFADVGNSRGAAQALLLPASHFEKYLVAWLYSLPVFLLIYVTAFLSIDALILQLASHGQPCHLLDFVHNPGEAIKALFGYSLMNSIALWGAIQFKQLHIIKIASLAFSLFGLLVIVNFQVLKRLLASGISTSLPFGDVNLGVSGQQLALPESQLQWLALVPLVLAALLWAAAYARLTEKQL